MPEELNEHVLLDPKTGRLTVDTVRIVKLLERIPEIPTMSPVEVGMLVALIATVLYRDNASEFLDIVREMLPEVNQQTQKEAL